MTAGDLQKIETFLRPLCERGIALAFSGGVDSSLLLAVLVKMHREKPFPFLVLNAVSTLQSSRDGEEILNAAAAYEITIHFVSCDVLEIPEVKNNSRSRCYHCKKRLFQTMLARAAEEGITTLLEGSHADDLKACRPGRKALEELGVLSVLEVLGFSKEDVRRMARALDVRTAERPSSPCLATRFDYGVQLTEQDLQMAGKGEAFLRKFLPENADLRLRVHGKLARIEVRESFFNTMIEHRNEIVTELENLGFEKITLDIAGFSSGSFDRIPKGKEDV